MILEGLRKVLEPLVLASNLTWLVFRSAFDMITEPKQIEECLQDPPAFFDYMLKKGGVVCKTLIALLRPKLEHLVEEQSMQWVAIVSVLEGIATVEMLLVAHETPQEWWKGIVPKLAGTKQDEEKTLVKEQSPIASSPNVRLMPPDSVGTSTLEGNADSPFNRVARQTASSYDDTHDTAFADKQSASNGANSALTSPELKRIIVYL